MSAFTCCSLNPIDLAHPGIAVATVRAGGVGLLDGEFCGDLGGEVAQKNLSGLIDLVGSQGTIGLRLRVEQILSSPSLLESLNAQSHWLILCGWKAQSLATTLESLPGAQSRQILLEITDAEQLSTLSQELIHQINGLIARGHESGGWGGSDPAFILTQKLVKEQNLPVYVQGGVGVHTAAACRSLGAAGVILDDQLWLMPESPQSEGWQKYLRNLNGQEAIAIGDRLGKQLRVLSRPGFGVIDQLQKLAEQLEIENATSERWQAAAAQLICWSEPGVKAWVMGQGVGLAAQLRERYRTTGRLIQAILRASGEQIQLAQDLRPLQPHSPLAVAHNTKYPIVQGPMTRVSDTAEFADAVSQAGGLPLLALALMRQPQVEKLLTQAKQLIGNRSWGVGILGFVPQALREAQLKVVKAIKPPFALIAGGRPDQAAQLEQEGISTYIHVPTPGLLKMFLDQGGKKFIFEGRECGGHVGPLSSFVLWESAIATLLEQVPPGEAQEIHVLFAGGIHDATSAAMVSAMAAPLAQRGIKIGVLMGSAYLFTQEAVECGAIVDEFQQQALQCQRTINLETGPGHASRCAVTPFAEEFYATRRKMLVHGASAEEIKNTLEDLTLGRLRVASKGLLRQGDQIQSVDSEQQLRDGMYMIGQVATMRHQVSSVAQLHRDVSEGSVQLLAAQTQAESTAKASEPSDIAIVGIGTVLPQAQSADTFWENILAKVNAITEIPQERWDWRLYYDADPQARDKVYSKWGGFLDDVPFDPIRFGIPPKSLKSIEPVQLLTLETVRRALADAGYEQGDFDRKNTSVILGGSGGMSDLGQQYATRSEIPRMVGNAEPETWERLPEWTEESFPGVLMNVTAGRVANRFDCGGANFTVDAACASSLAAVDLAVTELETGRCNVALAGGFDAMQSAFSYFCFSKTQALSPQGVARSFDQAADGIVISEGISVVVLKRLVDAERDGDRIYAVIKAVASSSDGKGMSMTAPASSGQQVALQRAYNKAGFVPSSIGMYEAHGTGTAAGDKTELETINSLLREHNATAKSCVLGSVKTMIGHTKSAAGITALVKAALALHYKVLPPHMNVDRPLEALNAEDSPLYLLQEAKPWLRHPEYPRRAGVSAFGFGGTNFHAVVEEYQGSIKSEAPGAKAWSYELLVFSGRDRSGVAQQLEHLQASLQGGAEPRLRDLAYSYARQAQKQRKQNKFGVSIVAENLTQLESALELVLTHLQGTNSAPLPPYIQIGETQASSEGQIAFLFPGQGAQYPNMAREVGLYFPEMRSALESADENLRDRTSQPLTQVIQPPSSYCESGQKEAKAQLKETQTAQPAIGAVEAGYLAIMARLGLKADVVCGHSYGEYAALYAAGVLSRSEFLRLSETRGRVMASACEAADGAMAAVQATREELLARLDGVDDVVLANHNAPLQSVISGEKKAVKHMVERLEVAEIMAKMLPVAGAFHSSLVESAQDALTRAIEAAPMSEPKIPVYSNTTARPYEANVAAIRQQLSQHLLSSVEFVSQIEAMYAAGTRNFIEIGPKSILTTLVGQILAHQEHTKVSVDGQGGGLKGFLSALGTLFNQGLDFNLLALFSDRDVHQINLSQLLESTRKPALSATTWLVNGGSARPKNEAVGYTGNKPPLNSTQKVSMSALNQKISQPQSLNNGKSAQSQQSMSNNHEQVPLPTTTNQQNSQSQPNLPPVNDAGALAAYQAYQQTMRQFLGLQEKVMAQFLGGSTGHLSRPQISGNNIAIPAPNIPEQKNNGNGNHKVETPHLQPEIIPEKPAPITPQTVASVTAKVQLDRASVTQMLLDLVSDRTGYPADLLGLDQDMEADLGIDSIKRVEIFGALQKTLPPSLAANVKEEMESFTQIKTLQGLVDKLLASGSDVAPAHQIQPKVTETPAQLDQASATKMLLDLVSDRTGYPADLLGLDQDMEADLGIDSIKRVEIFGALQKTLPPSLAANVKEEMESFTQIKTLQGLVDKLLASSSDIPTLPKLDTEAKELVSLGKSDGAVAAPRYVMQGKVQPLTDGEQATASLKGLFLITEDAQQVIAPQLLLALQQKGATPAIVSSASLADTTQLEQKLSQLRQEFGAIQGIIHLAGQSEVTMPKNLIQWQQLGQIQSKSLFQLLQLCANDLRECRGQVIATSSLGGYFGRNGKGATGLPLAGSSSGLLKTMAIEWEGVSAKIIDFDDTSATEVAIAITQELVSGDKNQEIGYYQGKRLVFEPQLIAASSLPSQGNATITPAADWVMLSIGGARGITAEVVEELMVPGMTLILVGRSPQPKAESEATRGVEELGALRKIFLQQALAQGGKPTPVQIEKQVQQLKRNRTISRNLETFRQAGVKVEYHSVDVRNAAEFGSLIDGIYERYGKIDAVVQGAGIIQDKLLVDKTLDSFNQVFDTKVDSTFLLSRYLRPESLKLIILFASVAGRTGNRGQCDYAAANEVVNRFAWWMQQQWHNTRVMSINWGPWDVTGMASAEVNRQFRERGVIPIPPAAGRKFVTEELRWGNNQEVELVAGIFEGVPQEVMAPETATSKTNFPLLPTLPVMQPNGSVSLEKTITLTSDPYLNDHRLDGKPVVPAAGALEYMAQLVQAAWSDWVVAEVRDLRVWRGIVLETEAGKTVLLKARASTHADSQSLQVIAEIVDPQKQIPFYRASFNLCQNLEEAPEIRISELAENSSLDVGLAYRDCCFHGEMFQLLTSIDQFTPEGVSAQVRSSNPGLWLNQPQAQNWLFDIGLVDASLQMALIWTHIQGDTGGLPAHFGSIKRYGNSPLEANLRFELRVKEFTPTSMIFDALLLDSQDCVRMWLQDMTNTCSKALKRLATQK